MSSPSAVSMSTGVRGFAAELAQHVEPGAPGHHDVEHERVEGFVACRGDRAVGVVREHDVEAVAGEEIPQQLCELLVVVGQENSISAHDVKDTAVKPRRFAGFQQLAALCMYLR